ncbi:MAG: voltage-gated potassium channel [Halieaceae bacterium]|jgi:voltage-gated potassium channel
MSLHEQTPLQERLYIIIFGTDTTLGKWFDILLILAILVSVAVITVDSMAAIHLAHGDLLQRIEWGFTALFSAEYLLRIWIARNRRAYLLSVYGLIDLLAILPSFLALIVPQAAPLLIVRLLRVLRVFRVLRLFSFLDEANFVAGAFRDSARQIFVFFSMVITTMIVFGCLMYVLEGPNNGFDNIPLSVYWAIVTITTVGYGDVVPVTVAGRTISAIGMLVGYAIIAVPTGIFTSKLVQRARGNPRLTLNCPQCARAGHENDAHYCRYCGSSLSTNESDAA